MVIVKAKPLFYSDAAVRWRGLILALLLILSHHAAFATEKKPAVAAATPAFMAKDIAVIVNDNDFYSVRIAKYYQNKRQIPANQIIHIRFKSGMDNLPAAQFKSIKEQVDQQTPAHVQGFVLTWLKPFTVDCMSITTAFAAGFDPAFCATTCKETRHNPYFASMSSRPYDDFGWRPAMMLAADSYTDATKLINRGVAADYTRTKGSAYLLKTTDKARSSRAVYFPEAVAKFAGIFPVHYLQKNYIEDQNDVMFYFTGVTHVQKLNRNAYLPGAIADHLTSAGGILTGSYQMSILDWLKAGVTGSYGAVVEPCNFPEKFSNPAVLMEHYLKGSTLLEAYWKSVAQPGQGVFVGEPLAKPFAKTPSTKD